MSENRNETGGYVDESTTETANTSESEPKQSRLSKNLNEVFGTGIGRLSIIVVGVVIVVVFALAIRGFTKSPEAAVSKAKVDSPRAPTMDKAEVIAVTERELERRSAASAKEAAAAAAAGKAYQPAFDPSVIAANTDKSKAEATPREEAGFNLRENPGKPGSSPIETPAPESAESKGGANGSTKNSDAVVQREIQRRQKVEEAYKLKLKARDEYIEKIRAGLTRNAEELIGNPGNPTTVANPGVYSSVAYYSAKNNVASTSATGRADDGKGKDGKGGKVKPLIKTGNILYATLDSEVNTDDNNNVFATIQGGEWSGSKLLGKIVREQDNISIQFTTLAPQDQRPTMTISALAMREEDAKLGIADDTNRHIVSRYGSLAAASLLSGYGKAFAKSGTQTTYLPNGGLYTFSGDPTQKQIIGQSVGEMGTSLAGEIRKNFNQPTTYSTPARKGMGVYFMQDVLPPEK